MSEKNTETFEAMELFRSKPSRNGARLSVATAPDPGEVLYALVDRDGAPFLLGNFPVQDGELKNTVDAIAGLLVQLGIIRIGRKEEE